MMMIQNQKSSRNKPTSILCDPVPIIQNRIQKLKGKIVEFSKNKNTLIIEERDRLIKERNRLIEEQHRRDLLVEKSCFSKFHIHFNPDCKKTFPLHELIDIAKYEKRSAIRNYEGYESYSAREIKSLLKAIPDMSTVLGGDPWKYSNSYSSKEAVEIYVHFLSVFLQKHSSEEDTSTRKPCSKCGYISSSEQEYFFAHMGMCFGCSTHYMSGSHRTKILNGELYRDLGNMNICSTFECESCFHMIKRDRISGLKLLLQFQGFRKNLNSKKNGYGDFLYPFVPSTPVSISKEQKILIKAEHFDRDILPKLIRII